MCIHVGAEETMREDSAFEVEDKSDGRIGCDVKSKSKKKYKNISLK